MNVHMGYILPDRVQVYVCMAKILQISLEFSQIPGSFEIGHTLF